MKRIAIYNQKGGVGKTTTTICLSGELARQGRRVLVVDVDPQTHATLWLERVGHCPSLLDVALGSDEKIVASELYVEGSSSIPEYNLSEISHQSRLDASAFERACDGLEKHGYLDRSDGHIDLRAPQVTLSEESGTVRPARG